MSEFEEWNREEGAPSAVIDGTSNFAEEPPAGPFVQIFPQVEDFPPDPTELFAPIPLGSRHVRISWRIEAESADISARVTWATDDLDLAYLQDDLGGGQQSSVLVEVKSKFFGVGLEASEPNAEPELPVFWSLWITGQQGGASRG